MFLDPDSGKVKFGKPTDGRDSRSIDVFEFSWGEDLIEFHPTINAGQQVSSVTVQGWDSRTKKPITYTAAEGDLPSVKGKGSGPESIKKIATKGKSEMIVDASVLSQEEARRLAISRLAERSSRFKVGWGRVIGQPKLRPGHNIRLGGLGDRFSGSYYVVGVTHLYGRGGYTTSFDVESLREKGK